MLGQTVVFKLPESARGIAQWLKLSAVLFILYTSDLCDHLTICQRLLCADDTSELLFSLLRVSCNAILINRLCSCFKVDFLQLNADRLEESPRYSECWNFIVLVDVVCLILFHLHVNLGLYLMKISTGSYKDIPIVSFKRLEETRSFNPSFNQTWTIALSMVRWITWSM